MFKQRPGVSKTSLLQTTMCFQATNEETSDFL